MINDEIQAELAIGLDEWMRNAISYHFGWLDRDFKPATNAKSGKKLRPVMALLAYQGAHSDGAAANLAPALPVAAAIEMIHNYSLIHDDIEDDDLERHGRATTWAIWGKPKAINVGDCLHVLAFRRLYRATERGLEAARTLKIAQHIADTSVKLALGQHKDLSFEDDLAVTPEMYLDMIGGKTAALISCSTYTGALAAIQEETRLNNFAEFGRKIGLGFQIRDDILGIWGLAADTGKPTGSDIRRRKKSLPVLVALNQSQGATRDRLLDIYQRTDPVTPDEERFVLSALEKCQAREYAQEQADRHKKEAWVALDDAAGGEVEKNPPLVQLKTLCTFLVERTF
jgi:geranylgeranyl diphosphate synthase type I